MKKGTVLALLLVVLGGGYGLGRLATRDKDNSNSPSAAAAMPTTQGPSDGVDRVRVALEGPMKGPADAKVTIVEFSDFQCPYCARAHQTMSEQVMKEYDGKVKLVYKNFPLGFHKFAEPAAIGGACAYQQDPAAFWTYYDFMFNNQQQVTPENVKEKAQEALKGTKVDMAKWNDCFDNKKTLEKVKSR